MGELSELVAKVRKTFEIRSEIKKLDEQKKNLNEELSNLSSQIIAELEDNEMERIDTDLGTFSYRYRSNFQVPKDDESRKAFFAYLKDKGVYEQLITVNSRTLNSWAVQEEQNSEELDFQIPGLKKSDPVAIPFLGTKK